MKSSDSLYSYYLSVCKSSSCCRNGLTASYCNLWSLSRHILQASIWSLNRCTAQPCLDQIHARSTVRAAYRLCIITSCLRMCIFIFAFRTHIEILHAGSFSVVRHGIEYGKSRSTVRTIYKRMHVSSVARIKEFFLTVLADCYIRRYEDISCVLLTLYYFKRIKGRHITFMGDSIQYHCPGRRHMLQRILKNIHISLGKYFYIGTLICNCSCYSILFTGAAHKRSEANALNDSINSYIVCERRPHLLLAILSLH